MQQLVREHSRVASLYVSPRCCPDSVLYASCVDASLQLPDEGVLLHVDLSGGHRRLGGSAFAQVFDQVGNDMQMTGCDREAFQQTIGKRCVLYYT